MSNTMTVFNARKQLEHVRTALQDRLIKAQEQDSDPTKPAFDFEEHAKIMAEVSRIIEALQNVEDLV